MFKLPKNANLIQKLNFIKQHPIQPTHFSNSNLDVHKLYFRKTSDGKEIARNWLSVLCNTHELKSFFCPICIAFSSLISPFTFGQTNFKHIHECIKKHEDSITHKQSVESFISASNDKSIEFGINCNLINLKRKQIEENIHVIKQVFEIIKLLGRQNLSFRGSKNSESLYKWDDKDNLNKGNFLELIKFTAERDTILYKHLNKAIKDSKNRKLNLEKKSSSSRGRGSLVTLLSKTTVNNVIASIENSIRNKIKTELGNKMFSIQVDSTQDIGASDQAAICIRYIFNGEVKERLFALLKVTDSSGQGYYEMLKTLFIQHNISFKNIIGESFDGASNMRGEYSGLQSKIKEQNEKSIYTWCYSHILNLCICDTCNNLDAKNLFGLLNRLSTFFGESYKRMAIWIQQNDSKIGSNKLKKLQKIGENNTRWWCREKSLFWIFEGDNALFPIVINALYTISISTHFDAKTCSEATSLVDKLSDFKIILTAHIFLQIFKITGPTSRYLQMKGLDLLTAWNMIDTVKQEIGNINFECIKKESETFSKKMNDQLSDMNLPDDLVVKYELSIVRNIRKKRMYDEICEDEIPQLPIDKFRINTFRVILDQIKESLNRRFSVNKKLIADVQFMLPKNFHCLLDMPKDALKELADIANIDLDQLKLELQNFSKVYPKISKSVEKITKLIYSKSETEEESDMEIELNNKEVDGIYDNKFPCKL